jgi:NADH dehydrogenase
MADLLRDAVKRRALKGEPRVLIVEMADRLVPGMGEEIRKYVENALAEFRIEVHTETRVVRVTETSFTLEHNHHQTELQTAGVVWVAGVRPSPLIEGLNVERDRRGLIAVEPTLQLRGYPNVFALGDAALCRRVPTLAGTGNWRYRNRTLRANRAFNEGSQLRSKHFAELRGS